MKEQRNFFFLSFFIKIISILQLFSWKNLFFRVDDACRYSRFFLFKPHKLDDVLHVKTESGNSELITVHCFSLVICCVVPSYSYGSGQKLFRLENSFHRAFFPRDNRYDEKQRRTCIFFASLIRESIDKISILSIEHFTPTIRHYPFKRTYRMFSSILFD